MFGTSGVGKVHGKKVMESSWNLHRILGSNIA